MLKYEALGRVSQKAATKTLSEKLQAQCQQVPARSRIPFEGIARRWEQTVLPLYKKSTRKNHGHILKKHLAPRFGTWELSTITTEEIQKYVTGLDARGYAPKTIDHIHDVLSAVLRSAVTWKYLSENPARGVKLPELKTIRPKPVLTEQQAADLLVALPQMVQAMVGLALLTGIRRCELFALRWSCFDTDRARLAIRESVYEGEFGTTKTENAVRTLPLCEFAVRLLSKWKAQSKRQEC